MNGKLSDVIDGQAFELGGLYLMGIAMVAEELSFRFAMPFILVLVQEVNAVVAVMGGGEGKLWGDGKLTEVDEFQVDVVLGQLDMAAVIDLSRVEYAHSLRLTGNALQLRRVLRTREL